MNTTLKRKTSTVTIKGDPRYFDEEVEVTPGVEQLLKEELVADGEEVILYDLKVDSTTFGVFRAMKRPEGGNANGDDDILIGSGQTGPAMNNVMTWVNGRVIKEKEKFLIKYKSFPNSQNSLVRAHLLVSDN